MRFLCHRGLFGSYHADVVAPAFKLCQGKGPQCYNPRPMSGSIVIKGAREHNLKNIDVEIPRDKTIATFGRSAVIRPE